jgi:hypothetical protein
LDYRRRNGSISLRVRCIKLCPTLHVGWLAVFRAIRPTLGIIVSGLWPDDLRLSDLEPRFVCKICGRRGANISGNNPPARMGIG